MLEMRGRLFVWICTLLLQDVANGGICWKSLSGTGHCKKLIMMDVSQEVCCNLHRGANVGWSSHSHPSSGLLFFWEFLSQGAPVCRRCHDSCKDVVCDGEKNCRMKKGKPRCVCKPFCTKEDKEGPICGTDMRKYKSRCQLLRHNCKYKTDIKVDYHGKCRDSCDRVECPVGRFCVEDQNGLPHCINCTSNCASTSKQPVCGSNLKTYDSACHLKAETCRSQNKLHLAYPGKCMLNATCASISCPSYMKCLVDPVTRQPSCTNCRSQCSPLSVVTVCGTDGISYQNYCKMRKKSCQMGILIQTKYSGHCHNKRRHGCRGCKRHLKRILSRRRYKKFRSRYSTNMYNFQKFRSKIYGGYSLNMNTRLKKDSKKEFG